MAISGPAVPTGALRTIASGRGLPGNSTEPAWYLGGDNESVLKRAVGPQIAPCTGPTSAQTPGFSLQDDHDYFDNDRSDR